MDERGTTLAEIADVTGLDQKTVWHATQGRKIQRSTRRLIAGFFGLQEAELFAASDIPNPIFPDRAQESA